MANFCKKYNDWLAYQQTDAWKVDNLKTPPPCTTCARAHSTLKHATEYENKADELRKAAVQIMTTHLEAA